MKRTLSGRASVVAVLEELPVICSVVVAFGSMIMIGIMLYRDWPQSDIVINHFVPASLTDPRQVTDQLRADD